ncbi:MAG: DEAD/DEAH box helicase [Candidatus Delongbacteria bacterium]|nr:DEAD/DEAH box helicase [Candidatus Delongbacteria bacterium]
MSFKDLGISQFFINKLEEQDLNQPYPIQKESIPPILKGKDVLGIAKTGSGKTLSYVLPILMNLIGNSVDRNRKANALILVPTRELANQVKEVFRLFALDLPERIKTLAVYGGVSINTQMQALQGVHVLIATLGRLIELVESNAVDISKISTLVLDEADKILNLGFKDEIDKILALLPKKRQNLLFSATLTDKIDDLNRVLLNDPVLIKIESDKCDIELINQRAYLVEDNKKGLLLRYLIKNENLKQVLVFTSSTKKADNLAEKLFKNGIIAASTHGKKSQMARKLALSNFKSGDIQVLVATDLLSRGIDIDSLPHVVNFELPRSPKDYIHRIGRTGRAETKGEAISLLTKDDLHHFKVIQKKMGTRVEVIDAKDIDLKGY